eukprot:TRINITY_DN2517_c0_g7_i3.p2 TRINITY_DN2517_c0_g7~~TRINITY_DN2517_c0_g7_i3.p2  ORF type:complete len:172 (+),score=63.08 TRINITY_DN2517_c0_g7_i3:972-1487(+)
MPLQQLPVNVAGYGRCKGRRKEDVPSRRVSGRSRNLKTKHNTKGTEEAEERISGKCTAYSNTISMQLDLSIILDASSEEDSSPSEGLTSSTNASTQDFPFPKASRYEAPIKRRHAKDTKEKSCMTRSKVERDANARSHLVRCHLKELYTRVALKVKLQKSVARTTKAKAHT